MGKVIGIDLGTTNTVVARWNDEIEGPEILHLNNICRNTKQKGEIDDSYTIPSCLYLVPPQEIYKFPLSLIYGKMRSRTGGLIGTQAIEKDGGMLSPRFITNFKSHLGKNNYQIIAGIEKWKYTAEEASRIFLRKQKLALGFFFFSSNIRLVMGLHSTLPHITQRLCICE